MNRWLVPLLGLALAAPAAAQEWQVAREQFAFAGSRLEIRVDAAAPGTLRVIRGQPGSVRVASRAVTGLTAAGLADGDELTLSAVGAGPVDYMISVPEGVWVTVRLPGRYGNEAVGSRDASRSFEWAATAEPTPSPAQVWLPAAADGPFETSLFTTHVAATSPATVSLPDLSVIRSVTVRIGGAGFAVAASRPLAVEPGSPTDFEIRPSGPPMDLAITIPHGAAEFSLRLGGRTGLVVRDGEATALCSPVTQQWLSDGRRWVTFTPVEGAVECGAEVGSRHEG